MASTWSLRNFEKSSTLKGRSRQQQTNKQLASMSLVVLAVYGLPGSSKSTLVREAAAKFAAEYDSSALTVHIVELDAFLEDPSSSSSSATSLWQGPEQWLQAQEKFYAAIASLARACCASGGGGAEKPKKTSVIIAVDNMPLKSMRSRVRSTVTSALVNLHLELSQNKNSSDESTTSTSSPPPLSFAFATIGIQCDLAVARERNSKRSGMARVPDSIIELMHPRMEFGPCKGEEHFTVDASAPPSSSSQFQTLISDKILKPLLQENKFASVVRIDGILLERGGGGGKSAVDEEEFHRASRTLSHQLDLVRRQSNGSFMAALKKAGAQGEVMKNAAKSLEKDFADIDRKVFERHLRSVAASDPSSFSVSSSSSSSALEQAASELGLLRDKALATWFERLKTTAAAAAACVDVSSAA